MSKATKRIIELGEFKGRPLLSVWSVDDNGDKVGKYPVISFGLGKARAILEHVEDIKKFVESNPAPSSSED